MWRAIEQVVVWMGARIESSDQRSGMLTAILQVDELGAGIRLHVEIDSAFRNEIDLYDGLAVTVKAADPRVLEPDEHLRQFLDSIERQFLEAVAARFPSGKCLKTLTLDP